MKRQARYSLQYKLEAVRLCKGDQAAAVTAKILGTLKLKLKPRSSSQPVNNSPGRTGLCMFIMPCSAHALRHRAVRH